MVFASRVNILAPLQNWLFVDISLCKQSDLRRNPIDTLLFYVNTTLSDISQVIYCFM